VTVKAEAMVKAEGKDAEGKGKKTGIFGKWLCCR
jgi:hypothetical protein